MDRSVTRTSVVLHKFAKLLWLKLRRDYSVQDSDLRIVAVSTRPTAIEEIDSEEERQARLRRKKATLGMDETMEVRKTHCPASSCALFSTDPIPQPVETSIAQHSPPDLVLCSDEPGGVLEPAQEERKAIGKSVPIGPNAAEKATHELIHTSFRNWCSYCVRARAADDPHHRQPYKEPEFPIIMADYCFVQDAPGKELFTTLDVGHCFRHDGGISVEEKRPLGGGRTLARRSGLGLCCCHGWSDTVDGS